MAVPPHVPATAQLPPAYSSPSRRADSWEARRPGEVSGIDQPGGAGLGFQGPDQGYALKLAEDFSDAIMLGTSEQINDVIAGCSAIALRRASLFGRAPVVHDLRLAFELFGYLDTATDEQVAWRRPLFAGIAGSHGYHRRLHLAATVPESTLRSTPAAVAAKARSGDWRALVS